MARYSKALKESVIQKMMPPHNVPVPQLVRETGISDVTLYSWRRKEVSQGVPVPGDGKIQINEHLKTNWQWSLKPLP